MQKLRSLLGSAFRDRSSSYRELAKIAGSIISVALAVGPISPLFTRRMYLAIESRSAWDSTLHFSAALLEELRFWYCNIGSFNGYSLWPPLDSSTVIFSDANDVGLQPITTLSSYGLTPTLTPPDAVAWMPWLETGAPKTIGCVPQFALLSTRSIISSLLLGAGP